MKKSESHFNDTPDKKLTLACDIWSLGVVAFIILSGFPPFYPTSMNNVVHAQTSISGMDSEMRQKIIKADYNTDGPEWDLVSALAKDFIKFLLVPEPEERPVISKVLEHEWLRGIETRNCDRLLAYGNRRNSDPEILHAAALAAGLMHNEVEVIGGVVFDKKATVPAQRPVVEFDSSELWKFFK